MSKYTMKRLLIFVACLAIAAILVVVCMCIRANKEQAQSVEPDPAITQEKVEPSPSEQASQITPSQIIEQLPKESDKPEESSALVESEPVDETSNPSETNQTVFPVINPIRPVTPIASEQPTGTLQPVKNVTVKINSKESIYGEPLKGLDFTIVSGNATYEEVAKVINLSKDPGNDAGTYRINVEFTNNNMGIILISEATYTIKARPVTVKVYNRSSNLGETLATLKKELTKGTLAEGDTLNDVIALTTNADKNRAGKYEIKASIKNNNYDVTLVDENGKLIDDTNRAWYNVTTSGSTVYDPENNQSDPPVAPSNKPINPGPGGEGGEEEKPPEEGKPTTPPNPGPGGEGGEEEKPPEEGKPTTPPNPGPGGEGGEEEKPPEEGIYT